MIYVVYDSETGLVHGLFDGPEGYEWDGVSPIVGQTFGRYEGMPATTAIAPFDGETPPAVRAFQYVWDGSTLVEMTEEQRESLLAALAAAVPQEG